MFHSRLFVEDAKYRQKIFRTCEADRPLFVQFCGNDPEIMLEAAKHVEHLCDAVDINLGCPQGIARKGHYGAFLLEEFDLLERIVSTLHRGLSIPVTCKIRLLPNADKTGTDMEKTLKLCRMLEAAGCQALTVHGRRKEQKKTLTGEVDWASIARIKVCF